MVESKTKELPEPKNKDHLWKKGDPSPNPAGRPKGIPSISGELKEGLLKAFRAAGGEERVIKLIKEYDGADKKKAALHDQRFWAFLKDIIVTLLPKKTEFDVEKRVLVLEFGSGQTEKFEGDNLENVFDVEVEDVRTSDDKGTGEGS